MKIEEIDKIIKEDKEPSELEEEQIHRGTNWLLVILIGLAAIISFTHLGGIGNITDKKIDTSKKLVMEIFAFEKINNSYKIHLAVVNPENKTFSMVTTGLSTPCFDGLNKTEEFKKTDGIGIYDFIVIGDVKPFERKLFTQLIFDFERVNSLDKKQGEDCDYTIYAISSNITDNQNISGSALVQ